MGEGYHNFHHQFPMDYRNAIKWYQFDPTKWFIATCAALGLASHLRMFPQNEIKKGELTMQLKRLKKVQDEISWPTQVADLPVVSWDSCEYLPTPASGSARSFVPGTDCNVVGSPWGREVCKEAEKRPLVIVSGFIHDVGGFANEHPGGRALLLGQRGKDATAAFCGGVYEHSNAAHNVRTLTSCSRLAGYMTFDSVSRSCWR